MQQNFFSLELVIDRQPLTVSAETPLDEVISLMHEWGNSCNIENSEKSDRVDATVYRNNSCVLVVEDNLLQGIFTERDLVKLVATGADTHNVTVRHMMTKEVVTLTATGNKDVFTALSLLREYSIRHLPVVDDCHNLLG